MIKGWRNDPAWVEFYAKRDSERMAREIKRIKDEVSLQQSLAAADAAMRRVHEKPLRMSHGIGY